MRSSVTVSKLHSVNLQEPIVVPLNSRLSLRLYEDSSPHCLETAALQKGFVLTIDDKEWIEEGLGYGISVVKYQDKTYFSSTAHIGIQKTMVGYLLKKNYVWIISPKKLGEARA